MAINPLNNHYSMENPASVFDEEAMTALELAGRTTAKVNECVDAVNGVMGKAQEQYQRAELINANTQKKLDDLSTQTQTLVNSTIPSAVNSALGLSIDSGVMRGMINEEVASLSARVDNLTGKVQAGSTSMDSEIIDARTDGDGVTHTNAGTAIRKQFKQVKDLVNGSTVLPYDANGIMTWTGGSASSLKNADGSYKIQHASGNEGISLPVPGMYNNHTLVIEFDLQKAQIDASKEYDNDNIVIYLSNSYGWNGSIACIEVVYTPGHHRIEYDLSELNFTPLRVFFVAEGTHFNSNFTISGFNFTMVHTPCVDINKETVPLKMIRNHLEGIQFWNLVGLKTVYRGFNRPTVPMVKFNSRDYYGIYFPVTIPDPGNIVHVEFDVEGAQGAVYVSSTTDPVQGGTSVGGGSGHVHITFDPSYYPVHKGFEVKYIHITTGTGGTTYEKTAIKNLKVYQNPFIEAGIEGETLTDALLSLSKQKQTTATGTTQALLVNPNGEKVALQVGSDGLMYGARVNPQKALFIGNSLLLGFGEFGMAASSATKDYYYLFNEVAKTKTPGYTSTRLGGSNWERLTSTEAQNAWLNNELAQHLTSDIDLVVVQLGDNVPTENTELFKTGCEEMLRFIRTKCPKARVAWMGAWYQTADRNSAMVNACQNTGSVFINIWDLYTADNQSAIGNTYTNPDGTIGTITSAGVASHPGDKGFKAIANRMLVTLGIVDTADYYK